MEADPSQILGHLDWSTIPAWMSYAEARNGPIGLFNDIVYANIHGSKGFEKELPGPLPVLSGGVSVDYELAIVEFGGAYEIWSGANPVVSGASSLDLLAGGRYWHQDVTASATLGPLNADRSGSVDWVDPFVGARLRQQIGHGESLVLRADVGGFGVGSDASWQVLATYNWEMRTIDPGASQGTDKSIVNQEKYQLNNSTKEDVPTGASGSSSGASGTSTPGQSLPQMEKKDLQ